MRSVFWMTILAILFSLTATVQGQEPQTLTLDSTPGRLTAKLSDGRAAWMIRVPDKSTSIPQGQADGLTLMYNGYLISPQGRVLNRLVDNGIPPLSSRSEPSGAGRPVGETGTYWDPLGTIMPPPGSNSDYFGANSPMFDSNGNAWVILSTVDGGDWRVKSIRSQGHSGAWDPIEMLTGPQNNMGIAEGTIDPSDNITIAFRDLAGDYDLYALRYEPGTGWSGPDMIYTTTSFWQAVEIAADAQGNVVVVFDPSAIGGPIWTIIRDAGTGLWGTAHQVSPAGYEAMLPTVVKNRAGDTVYLLYRVDSGGPTGLYAHRFNSTTRSWGPAEFLPGTSQAGYSYTSADSRLPVTVDDNGEATVFWQTVGPSYGIYANRTQAGVWQNAHELLAPGPDDADIENFTDADSSVSGDALGVVMRSEYPLIRLYAFRYDAATGWEPTENPYSLTLSSVTRSGACFYRGSRATATFWAEQDSQLQLSSLIHTGSSWQPDLLDIPGERYAYNQNSAADRGEELLVFEDMMGYESFGTKSTWLRSSPSSAVILTGPGPGSNNPPLVRIFDPSDNFILGEFAAYGTSHYGLNVAAGDLDGNGIDEILTGPGPGPMFGPQVRGFDTGGTPIPGVNFMAYGTPRYGVNVAAGDLDGDGFDEIITGAGPGAVFGPHVRAFNFDGGPAVAPMAGVSYFAYGTLKWGVNVTCGDIDGDGYDEIVTGPGPGNVFGPHVRGWNVDGGEAIPLGEVSFMAYSTAQYGVNVSCGDVDQDGIDEIITGAGPGSIFGTHVRGWDFDGGSAVNQLPGFSFLAWPFPEMKYGVNVHAGHDLTGDGRDDLLTGLGPDPDHSGWIKGWQYTGSAVELLFQIEAYAPPVEQGTHVAAANL